MNNFSTKLGEKPELKGLEDRHSLTTLSSKLNTKEMKCRALSVNLLEPEPLKQKLAPALLWDKQKNHFKIRFRSYLKAGEAKELRTPKLFSS